MDTTLSLFFSNVLRGMVFFASALVLCVSIALLWVVLSSLFRKIIHLRSDALPHKDEWDKEAETVVWVSSYQDHDAQDKKS
jgi:hypothetical protein